MAIEGYDTVNNRVRIRFVEQGLWQFDSKWNSRVVGDDPAEQRLLGQNFGSTKAQEIKDKWLYVFYTPGSTKFDGINSVAQAKRARLRLTTMGQHMASYGRATTPPERTKEQAKHVYAEVYFDRGGAAWVQPLTDSEATKKTRVDRPQANAVVPQFRDNLVDLPMVIDGQPVRYYFLLSSVRLGPHALSEATSAGGADGLTIWRLPHFVPPTQDFGGYARVSQDIGRRLEECAGPTSGILKSLSNYTSGSIERQYLRRVCTVQVVDPYHMAGDINTHAVEGPLQRYAMALLKMQAGQNPVAEGPKFVSPDYVEPRHPFWTKIEDRHFKETSYKGSFEDLYFIASVLRGIDAKTSLHVPGRSGRGSGSGKVDIDWDEKAAGQVLSFVEHGLPSMQNAIETGAKYLAHWLASPAHRLIDIAATFDTTATTPAQVSGAKRVGTNQTPHTNTADPLAASDRAYGLQHWYNSTTHLSSTRFGTAHLLHLFTSDDDEAVGHTPLLRLIKHAAPLDKDTGLADAFVLVRDYIPDLTLRAAFFSHAKNPDDAGMTKKQADAFRDMAARTMFLSSTPVLDKVDPSLTDRWKSLGPYAKMGFFLADPPDSAKDIWAAKIPVLVKNPHFAAVSAYASKHTTPLIKETRSRLPKVKVAFAFAGAIFSAAETAGSWKRATGTEKAIAVGGMVNDVAGVVDAVMALYKIDDVLSLAAKQSKAGSAFLSAGRAAIGRALCRSFIGFIGGVWQIFTGVRGMIEAYKKGDASVVIAQGLTVIAGVLTVAAVFVETGVLLLVGVVLGIIAAFLCVFTADSDFQVFAGHCYFAPKGSTPNKRSFLPADPVGGAKHWGGRHPGGTDSWPVTHQRLALENLVSRFAIDSVIAGKTRVVRQEWTGNVGHDIEAIRVESIVWTLRYSPLLSGAVYDIEINHPGSASPLWSFRFHPGKSGASRFITTGNRPDANISGTIDGGALVVRLGKFKKPQLVDFDSDGKNLVSCVTMTQTGGGRDFKLKLDHTMIERAPWRISLNNKPSGPAKDFENVMMPSLPGSSADGATKPE